jgi:uncharacterized damage-inducible protein DinB
MTYYGAHHLAESFRTVRKNTVRIAEDIPETKYLFRATPETRSVAQLLAHIAQSYTFQHQIHAVERRTTIQGFDFPALMQRMAAAEQQPRTKDQIIDMLRSEGDKWAGWVAGLSDDFLSQSVGMPTGSTPESKSRFEMILSVKEHEMHHRGQLMVLERLCGIVPHMTREMQERMAQHQKNATQG